MKKNNQEWPSAQHFKEAKVHADVSVTALNQAAELLEKKSFPVTLKVVHGKFISKDLSDVKEVGVFTINSEAEQLKFYEALCIAKVEAKLNDKNKLQDVRLTGCIVVDNDE